MSSIDLLLRHGSTGSQAVSNRSDFHIYINPFNGVGTPQLDASGYAYYKAHGINMSCSHYQISGSNTYNQTPPGYAVQTQVQTFWTNPGYYPDHTPNMDLWYFDTETSAYTGTAANAATDLAAAQNAVNWTNLYWDVYTTDPVYVGNYGNSTGIRTQAVIGYPFSQTEANYETLKNDNDVNGQYVAAAWDWMGPELYQRKIDEFIQGLDWLCNEKARLGITTPLIPFVWVHDTPSTITTYEYTTAQLEYAYSRPECNGLLLWGTTTAAAGPTYYDGQDWMQAALDFTSKYSISAGTPF